ncbi:DUF1345 domain-containing protein [Brevundimonas sp. UBA7534]|uniref:DUF1345 domain-containing protein n=1 Tax=Brevundimonas sp. UBA7534 TaxID=1946138 RepID=UPI0025C033D0|nr:DUF1345 domain-containing protein [Brevundimonas sp. UBA7534]
MTRRAGLLRLHWPLAALLAVAASSPLWPVGGGLLMRLALGWNAGVAVYLAGTLVHVGRHNTAAQIRARAASLDQAGPAILPLALLAAGASLAVVAGEGVRSGGPAGAALALLTVALSWTFVQVIFALHYAHRFYSADAQGKDRKGLLFPGERTPDYWDFLHFAIIIGVANQTADVQIAERGLRRLSTLHSLTAFVFNTVILALAVNLAVSLLSGPSPTA